MLLTALLLSVKGVYATVITLRKVKRNELSKGNKEREIWKETTHRVRLCVERDNKKVVIEARANGDAPATNQGLKGKEWVVYPVMKKSLRTQKHMFPVNTDTNRQSKTTSRFFENGEEITREAYVDATIPSLHKKKGLGDMYDITVDNVLEIRVSGKRYRLAKMTDKGVEVEEIAKEEVTA